MTRLTIDLGTKADVNWAQETVARRHYLRQRVYNRARPMVYVVRYGQRPVGLVMVTIPHATKCRGWWGYPGLITQWQVLDMCRVWLDPAVQQGGELCLPGIVPHHFDRKGIFRPTVATWCIDQVLGRVQRDRISLWPPIYPQLPYHIRLIISYHDPQYHRGTIYRESGAIPMYTDSAGNPIPGPSGKYGWCWPLEQPDWEWSEIKIAQPRTMRLPF